MMYWLSIPVIGLLLAMIFGPIAHTQVILSPLKESTVACAYNTAIPAPSNGQFFFVQCDANGRVLITSVSTPQTTGGLTPLRLSALSTAVTAIKATAGQLFMFQAYNPNATVAYVQIFNATSGSVTLGTTSPTLSIPLPATQSVSISVSITGMQFNTAISAAATTTATGSTAPGTAIDCNVAYN